MAALSMAAIHDLAEARTGDLDFIAKNYCKDDEDKAIKDQFQGLGFGDDLQALLNEYEVRQTRVAKCAKDADSLAQLYMEWHLMWQGNNLAKRWFKSDFINRVPNFYTNTAKSLANAMKKSNPNKWWSSELVSKSGQVKNLRHLMGKSFKN